MKRNETRKKKVCTTKREKARYRKRKSMCWSKKKRLRSSQKLDRVKKSIPQSKQPALRQNMRKDIKPKPSLPKSRRTSLKGLFTKLTLVIALVCMTILLAVESSSILRQNESLSSCRMKPAQLILSQDGVEPEFKEGNLLCITQPAQQSLCLDGVQPDSTDESSLCIFHCTCSTLHCKSLFLFQRAKCARLSRTTCFPNMRDILQNDMILLRCQSTRHFHRRHDFLTSWRSALSSGISCRKPPSIVAHNRNLHSPHKGGGKAPVERGTQSNSHNKNQHFSAAELSLWTKYLDPQSYVIFHPFSKNKYRLIGHTSDSSPMQRQENDCKLQNPSRPFQKGESISFIFPPAELAKLKPRMPMRFLLDTALQHEIVPASTKRMSMQTLVTVLEQHVCQVTCPKFCTYFSPLDGEGNLTTNVTFQDPLWCKTFMKRDFLTHCCASPDHEPHVRDSNQDMLFVNYVCANDNIIANWSDEWIRLGFFPCRVPLDELLKCNLSLKQLQRLGRAHRIQASRLKNMSKDNLRRSLETHECLSCPNFITIVKSTGIRQSQDTVFPPTLLTQAEEEDIVSSFCDDMSPNKLEETGCAVCGQLVLKHDASVFDVVKDKLSWLIPNNSGIEGVTRRPRNSLTQPIREIRGPIYDATCTHVCNSCETHLMCDRIPPESLANGNWLGDIPPELQGLTYAEKFLIARVRKNACVTRVAGGTGMPKLIANAISFPNPVFKIYDILPPAREELQEVLAVLFVGHTAPGPEELKRLPLLVRRNKVRKALQWLILNHVDYSDVTLSEKNLAQYTEDDFPVTVEWMSCPGITEEPGAVTETGIDEGTSSGECSFTVQGVTGHEMTQFTTRQFKIAAMNHLADPHAKMLLVGHEPTPEGLWNNPTLYPKMFPWLFPYGLGGIGNLRCESGAEESPAMTQHRHVQWLLNYHDKHFQTDEQFTLIAFNNIQIREGTNGGHIMTDLASFPDISRRLRSLKPDVLQSLTARMEKESYVKPQSDDEKRCFEVMDDLDIVARHVKGSLTLKKHMRNEIWSLVSHLGAPLWFITFAPSDITHPLALYYADTNETFEPLIRLENDRKRLIAKNPVASAKFFHKIVELFIKHILGMEDEGKGLFGDTEAYYGTVEQQGRLTLHLHLLLWIKGALNPKAVRERLQDPASEFNTELIAYLEHLHRAELFNGTVAQAKERRAETKKTSETPIPAIIERLPEPPVSKCEVQCEDVTACNECKRNADWWKQFYDTVDDIAGSLNVHDCNRSKNCGKGKPCKARCPREVHHVSTIDPNDGHITLKHVEPMMNRINPILTYVLQCNTDVTSLMSGTAVKAVVAYVADYITKTPLKTYGIMDAIRRVVSKNTTTLENQGANLDGSRQVMTKIVNALTSKLEIGAPMAASYLLDLPDHYTSHQFVPFYWRSYVSYMQSTLTNELECDAKVTIVADQDQELRPYVAAMDYAFRPQEYQGMSLHEWVSLCPRKIKLTTAQKQQIEASESTVDRWVIERAFTDGHPQRSTHSMSLANRNKHKIPNFIGGSMPRSDHGDREFYCKTMLTLFKPWRSGTDLKRQDQSWDQKFDAYWIKFRSSEKQLMANFNVRYECNDARDDFRKDRQKEKLGWLTDEVLNDLDDAAHYRELFGDTVNVEAIDVELCDLANIGRQTGAKLAEMNETHDILQQAGWLDESRDGVEPIAGCADSFELPDITRHQWEAVIKKGKLEARSGALPTIDELDKVNDIKMKEPVRFETAEVKIVDRSYLERDFEHLTKDAADLIDHTITQFTLNKEQERAFRIIANHASTKGLEQLKMYLGGMGGTGKSRVIDAVIALFRARGEAHRFLVLAPTGSAAALVGGFTYHSVLGFKGGNGDDEQSVNNKAAMKERLEGVEYIFFDEVSMLSCRKLYLIAQRLGQMSNDPSVPFGNINMIFAGDFAQLPPVFEGVKNALYSNSIGTGKATSNAGIEAAIGKTLWHQVTTVVILRQNMRQTKQSKQDSLFHRVLENMRFGACTPSDIKFLKTMIASPLSKVTRLAQKKFRDVSIIVTRNIQRDKINILGCERFAREKGEELHLFHSDDQWAPKAEIASETRAGNKRKRQAPLRITDPLLTTIDDEQKPYLWNLPHSMTDHKPGILKLCRGMPVLIKHNVATELCITNGAEAIVERWKYHVNWQGKKVLDILFVTLKNPPKKIKLPGLPENVVPILPISSDVIECMLPNDQKVPIKRKQVPVLPNFAMTDYTSQGKTREHNIVNLSASKYPLLSYYTCLSRSSSADNTVILQGFDPYPMTCGTVGHIRQEFRELEILDHISEMCYDKQLDSSKIYGRFRNLLISRYREHFGPRHVPKHVHPALDWSKEGAWDLYDEYYEYEGSEHGQEEEEVQTDEEQQEAKDDAHKELVGPLNKKQKLSTVSSSETERSKNQQQGERRRIVTPIGLIWDSTNWSCAYDAVLFILFNTWNEDIIYWRTKFGNGTDAMKSLGTGFLQVVEGKSTLATVRLQLRKTLFRKSAIRFPLGEKGASVTEVADAILTHQDRAFIEAHFKCDHCDWEDKTFSITQTVNELQNWHVPRRIGLPTFLAPKSIARWFEQLVMAPCYALCKVCGHRVQYDITKVEAIPFLVFSVKVDQKMHVSKEIVFHSNGTRHTYKLKGLIYFGGYHFTSTYIESGCGTMWHNDDMTHGENSVYVGNIKEKLNWEIIERDGRKLTAMIYSLDGKEI